MLYDVMKRIVRNVPRKFGDKILAKIFKRTVIKPWMRYKEIEIIEKILKNLQPKNCLEWGSGFSTIYFPKFLNGNSKWIAVEHDGKWATKIKGLNQNSNVKIFHIPPNSFPWTDKYGNGAYSDLKEYVEFPSKYGSFDFIMIDGRARKSCLMKAYELVSREGVVILHDANREYYNWPTRFFKNQALFRDHRRDAGGLWIGTKEIDMGTVLKMKEYKRYWQLISKLEKIIGIGGRFPIDI